MIQNKDFYSNRCEKSRLQYHSLNYNLSDTCKDQTNLTVFLMVEFVKALSTSYEVPILRLLPIPNFETDTDTFQPIPIPIPKYIKIVQSI